MDNKKHIDRLFQEKFKDFEAAPSDAVWERISENLPVKKKKRRVIALWWQIGGVAAIIALLLTIGNSVFNTDGENAEDFPIVNTNTNENDTKSENNDASPNKKSSTLDTIEGKTTKVVNTNTDAENETHLKAIRTDKPEKQTPLNQQANPHYSKQKQDALVNHPTAGELNKATKKQDKSVTNSNENDKTLVAEQKPLNSPLNTDGKTLLKSETERKSTIKNTLKQRESDIAENTSTDKTNTDTSKPETTNLENSASENPLIETPEEHTIENAIAENSKTIDEEGKEDERNRWSIAPNVAPVYFSSLGKGSSLDKQFNDNSKSSDINMSYGIAGSYAISKKLKIRAGVNRVNLNQVTADVFAYTGAETAARGADAEFANISFKDGTSHVSLMSSKMMDRGSAPELFNAKIAGNIEQKFGFIEVPVELEYRLLDKRFGVNVISGFSTLILSDNEIYADVNGSTTLIGEANNINSTSFSANFGLGMDYNFSNQWQINLEPTFKYQINTFNNTTGDFKPFFIGVYTGLSFKF